MTTHPAPPDSELVALLELSEKATPGIWEMYGGTNHARVQTADVIVCDGSPPHFMGKEDAKFIAALVNWFRQTAPTLPGAGGGEWLPIESAPTDGTRIMLGVFRKPDLRASDYYLLATWDGENSHPFVPNDWTHWQPLPTPPPAELGEDQP